MLEINMTCLVIESRVFGAMAEIWVATAYGHWAVAAGGMTHSGKDKLPASVALMKLLHELKRSGLTVSGRVPKRLEKRLRRVIDEGDIAALERAILWPEHPEHALGVRYKDGKFREIRVDISDKIWKKED